MTPTDIPTQKVLYLIACAAPPASKIQEMVSVAQEASWDVCIVATPEAAKFIDAEQLTRMTNHPVRTGYKLPGQEDALPKPDAIVVIPATFNTINKWALGIADTLAVSILCEHLGSRTPLVAVPYLKDDLAKHPAFNKSLKTLRRCGVHVLYDPKRYAPPTLVPWQAVMSELTRISITSEEVRAPRSNRNVQRK